MTLEIDPALKKFVRTYTSEKRLRHSIRVAEYAARLAEVHGVDKNRVVTAALLHDIGRELRKKDLRMRASKYDKVDSVERRQHVLLHGKAGAAIARDEYGIEDEGILEAIKYHTTGKPGMSKLAKILFIADNIEPDRKHSTPEYRNRILRMPLDEVLRKMIEDQVSYLKKRGKSVADVTAALYVELTHGVDIVET